jgi:hypothetical protein
MKQVTILSHKCDFIRDVHPCAVDNDGRLTYESDDYMTLKYTQKGSVFLKNTTGIFDIKIILSKKENGKTVLTGGYIQANFLFSSACLESGDMEFWSAGKIDFVNS